MTIPNDIPPMDHTCITSDKKNKKSEFKLALTLTLA